MTYFGLLRAPGITNLSSWAVRCSTYQSLKATYQPLKVGILGPSENRAEATLPHYRSPTPPKLLRPLPRLQTTRALESQSGILMPPSSTTQRLGPFFVPCQDKDSTQGAHTLGQRFQVPAPRSPTKTSGALS